MRISTATYEARLVDVDDMDLFGIFMNATNGDEKQAIEAYSGFIMIMNELFQYMYDNGLTDIFDGMIPAGNYITRRD